MERPLLALVAIACGAAAVVWGRSAAYRQRVLERIRNESGDSDLKSLVESDLRKDVHTTILYGVISFLALTSAVFGVVLDGVFLVLLAVPIAITFVFGRNFMSEARLAQNRSQLERRAQEVLVQDQLAPKRWAARLAPEELPDFTGFEIGTVYQAGSGLMAGDFYDVFRVAPTRLVAVIGDVSGHGIDPAITAFQAKYLLRVFLRQFRDPAQALQELNVQMAATGRLEEFISAVVLVFDTQAGTLRYASAGHRCVAVAARCDRCGPGPLHADRPQRELLLEGDPAGDGRRVPDVHRRARRGPQRGRALRRGAHRQLPPA